MIGASAAHAANLQDHQGARTDRGAASEVLGIKQPHVSTLMRNRAGNFSVGRLMEFLTALGQDVQITVKPTRKARGEMAVVGR